MGSIVVVLLLALALAAAIMFYVAFPYRDEETPLTPRLGEVLRRGVESLPTLDGEERGLRDKRGASVDNDSHH
jgi:hypothetical protein